MVAESKDSEAIDSGSEGTRTRSSRDTDLPIGARVNRYVILGALGKGGMGVVYRAYDPDLDRRIALKFMSFRRTGAKSPSLARTRILREAQALAQLSHHNVVAVHDVGTFGEDVFIAMELLEGKTARAWIADEKPSIKQILGVYLEAGQGLLAAHKVGLVHRDFKPENIIVCQDGRVCVIDFGLARAAGNEDADTPEKQPSSELELSSGQKYLRSRITQADSMLGTMVYMSPEQLVVSEEADERSDQFSFTSSLFEALYGQLAFWGKDDLEFQWNVTCGKIRFPEHTAVPPWIAEILTRGLKSDPTERFPSMNELLAALRDDPFEAKQHERAAKRKTFLSIGAGLSLGALLVGGVMLWARPHSACRALDQKLVGVWDADVRHGVQQAFLRTQVYFAKDMAQRVVERLDQYASGWQQQIEGACRGENASGADREWVRYLQMGCLEHRAQELKALGEVFLKADREVVERAVDAVVGLSRLEECKDTRRLRAQAPPPVDPELKREVVELRGEISRSASLDLAGKLSEGLALAETTTKKSQKINYIPAQAEALMQLGRLQVRLSKNREAWASLSQALALADRSGHDEVRARALTELIYISGHGFRRYEEAQFLITQAQAVLDRIGGEDRELQANLISSMGSVYYRKGDYPGAINYYQQALSLREKSLGSNHLDVGLVLNQLGWASLRMGEFDKAAAYVNRAIEIRQNAVGMEHPSTAVNYYTLGVIASDQGAYDLAREYYLKAEEIHKKTAGPDCVGVGLTQLVLGKVAYRTGDPEGASAHFRRSLEILERMKGPEDEWTIWSRTGLGLIHLDRKQYQNALAQFDRVLSICSQAHPCSDNQSEALADTQLGLAKVLIQTGKDPSRVNALAQSAEKIFQGSHSKYSRDRTQEIRKILAERTSH